MRHHHSIKHNKRLPNSKCDECSKEFYSKGKERKYCDDCFSLEGEMNPAYSGGKTKTVCKICGSEFLYYESEKEGFYCGDCVEEENWRDIPDVKSGKENPRYSTKIVECDMCEKDIKVTESKLEEYSNNFCSRDCYGMWRSKNQTGKRNPNFVDGRSKTELYIGNWSKNKKKALERDNYTCQKCGKTKEEIGRNPDVHHKIPIRTFDDISNGHKIKNLICLCPECHTEEENR